VGAGKEGRSGRSTNSFPFPEESAFTIRENERGDLGEKDAIPQGR